MDNSEPLIWLGFAIIIACGSAICVPYLRGKSDALTAWNIFLLGGALFTGVGSLAVVWGDFHRPELKRFQPTKTDVRMYVIGSIAFYGTVFISYFVLKLPRRISARVLNKWPPLTLPLLVSMLLLFGALVIGSVFTRGVFFIGPALMNVSHKALVFAVVFSFCYWYQDKRQIPMLVLFLGVFVLAALDAMVIFEGRRLLLSIAVAPLICMYWLHWRYKAPKWNLLFLGIATFSALSVAAFYSSFRHFSRQRTFTEERTIGTTIEAMKGTSASRAMEAVTRDTFNYFSQYNAHYSLLTLHLLNNGQIQVEPLNSVIFLVGYPVPRVAWENKPQPLAIRMVREILRLPYKTNWGLGAVATGYQEGGIPVIMLYGFLIVVLIRIIDDAIARQPTNVFLLAILSTSAPHFATMIRGELCVMTAEITESIVFAVALGIGARFIFGTAPYKGTVSRLRQYYPLPHASIRPTHR